MFTFKTSDGDREYKVYFKYDREVVDANPAKADSKEHSRPYATKCVIKHGDNIAIEREARTHYKDQFDYKKGRKIALKRALEALKFDRSSRTNAWKAMLKK